MLPIPGYLALWLSKAMDHAYYFLAFACLISFPYLIHNGIFHMMLLGYPENCFSVYLIENEMNLKKLFLCLRAAELSMSLPHLENPILPEEENDEAFKKDFYQYSVAKSYFDLKEFDRAAYALQNCKSSKAYFLHLYSQYMVSQNNVSLGLFYRPEQ